MVGRGRQIEPSLAGDEIDVATDESRSARGARDRERREGSLRERCRLRAPRKHEGIGKNAIGIVAANTDDARRSRGTGAVGQWTAERKARRPTKIARRGGRREVGSPRHDQGFAMASSKWSAEPCDDQQNPNTEANCPPPRGAVGMGFRLNGHDLMHIDDQSGTNTRPSFRKLGKQSTRDECFVGQMWW